MDNLLVCVKALCISKIKYIWCSCFEFILCILVMSKLGKSQTFIYDRFCIKFSLSNLGCVLHMDVSSSVLSYMICMIEAPTSTKGLSNTSHYSDWNRFSLVLHFKGGVNSQHFPSKPAPDILSEYSIYAQSN